MHFIFSLWCRIKCQIVESLILSFLAIACFAVYVFFISRFFVFKTGVNSFEAGFVVLILHNLLQKILEFCHNSFGFLLT